jgi:hypothetical protein
MITVDDFFGGKEKSKQLFNKLNIVLDNIGVANMRVGKSQISFRRRRAFAWVWMPDKYLQGKYAPLVLSLSLQRRDPSPRWKEIVEPYPGRFTHHMEIYSTDDIDSQVRAWIEEAWTNAANGRNPAHI